jgi:hypothetical protein
VPVFIDDDKQCPLDTLHGIIISHRHPEEEESFFSVSAVGAADADEPITSANSTSHPYLSGLLISEEYFGFVEGLYSIGSRG